MKTVITSSGDTLQSTMDPRFGRCAYFCVYEHDSGTTTFVKNQFADAMGGAGQKVAEQILTLGVQRIVSGDFGPKAKELLDKYQVQLVKFSEDHKTIQQIIETLK
ncbi:MAG: dinitrogenase iron-molybdenum cofactor biosynthesis protein [Clostridia bacterium]|nr:dinitrogenase iron-molybdenum cofactor biosynthesis protein [Clostridia bacterium]